MKINTLASLSYKNHIYVVQNSRYDSPERQTFVTEGWFTAGDFLQQQKAQVKASEV